MLKTVTRGVDVAEEWLTPVNWGRHAIKTERNDDDIYCGWHAM